MSRTPVMTTDEIRYWMQELHDHHGWRWECLARTFRLGEGKHAVSKVRRKVWFKGGEQQRCSRQIDRILSGELVPVIRGKRQDAVVSDNQVPIQQPARLVYDFASGRLRWKQPREVPAPILPSFRTALKL